MDEETKKMLQNLAQQQARTADAAAMTIDKKPFTINLHMVYGAIGINILIAWTVIGWIKDVDDVVQKSKQAPAALESIKTNIAAAQSDIKDLRRITSETDARVTKQETTLINMQDATRPTSTDPAKVLLEIKDLKNDVKRVLDKAR